MKTAGLDLPGLLAPVHVDALTGKDLRTEDFNHSLYYKIKDARNLVRNLERRQRQGADILFKPDWSTVYQLALSALATQTKDLEIAAWLLEASLREHGFAGLRDGFKLVRELINQYWDHMYPLPDEDGLITRLAPLTGLNGEDTEGTLIAPIALVPLTQGRSAGPFSLWQYQQAVELIKITDKNKRNQRLAAGAVTLEMIAKAVAETPANFFQEQFIILNSCIEEFKMLTQVLAEKAGHDAPPSSRILMQLQACVDCMTVIAKESIHSHVPTQQTEAANHENPAMTNATHHFIDSLNKPVELSHYSESSLVREQILQSLQYAADFFRRTEPHSPIPYLLERAVKWSAMPLHNLLKELITDEQALGYFCNLTGVKMS
jgi:type VI secretion system protein ImpA